MKGQIGNNYQKLKKMFILACSTSSTILFWVLHRADTPCVSSNLWIQIWCTSRYLMSESYHVYIDICAGTHNAVLEPIRLLSIFYFLFESVMISWLLWLFLFQPPQSWSLRKCHLCNGSLLESRLQLPNMEPHGSFFTHYLGHMDKMERPWVKSQLSD